MQEVRARLEAIKSLCEKAQCGPWERYLNHAMGETWSTVHARTGKDLFQIVCSTRLRGNDTGMALEDHDAAFIAASRSLVPALVAALEVAHTALRDIAGWCPDTPETCRIAECKVSRDALAGISEIMKESE